MRQLETLGTLGTLKLIDALKSTHTLSCQLKDFPADKIYGEIMEKYGFAIKTNPHKLLKEAEARI